MNQGRFAVDTSPRFPTDGASRRATEDITIGATIFRRKALYPVGCLGKATCGTDPGNESELGYLCSWATEARPTDSIRRTIGLRDLILERRGRVAWLILNRPESLNAHNLTMLAELPREWAELDADDDVGVIVLTGRGKAFSAGADVKEVAASGGGMRERLQPFSDGESPTQASARSAGVSKPVIAAVNGVCAGGGLLLLAGCDLAVAASTATFLDPHVSVGQTTGLEPVELVGIMPLGDIFRMAFVGSYERLEATDAHRLGLVSEVVDPPDLLEDRVQALAESICRNSRLHFATSSGPYSGPSR